MENQENHSDERSLQSLPSRSRLMFIYLTYCYSYFKFVRHCNNLHIRFRPLRTVLFNTLFVALLEVSSIHIVLSQHEDWRNIGLQGVPVVDLIINETRPFQGEACSTGETVYAVTPANIYIWSGDGGWCTFNDFHVDQEITCFPEITKQGQKLICESRYGIIQSSPLGSDWQILCKGFGPDHSILSLSVSRSYPKIIYAVLANDESELGDDELVKSSDGGETWFRVESFPHTESFIHLRDVYVDPKQSNIVYVTRDDIGVASVFKSVDGGTTWQRIEHHDGMDEITNLVFDPVNPNTIYFIAGTVHQRAIYKSTDGLKTCHLKISIDHLYTFMMHPQDRKHLYATAFPRSILESTDAGETWSSIETDSLKESFVLSVGVNNYGAMYVGTQHNGVFVRELPGTKLSSFYGSKKTVISAARDKPN
jgi:photosystem II stability/assembly factor-like uncharacterized protein